MEIVRILKSDLLLPGLTSEGALIDERGRSFSGAGEYRTENNFTKGSYTLEMTEFETDAHHLYIKEGDEVVLEVMGVDKGTVVASFELKGDSQIRFGTADKDGNPSGTPASSDILRIYKGDINAAEVRLRPTKLIETKQVDLQGWYLEGTFPLEAADHVQQDYIIMAKTKSKGEQPFRINNVQKKKRTVEFEANHIVFDMRRYTIDSLPMEDVGVANALKRIKDATDRPNPFKFNATLTSTKSHVFEPQTMLDAIGFLIEHWGGRLDINGLNMTLREEMGEDRGETISYGKNLEDIRVWENWDGVVTKLFVIGPDGVKLPETYVMSQTQYDNVYSGVETFTYSDRIEEEDSEEAKLDDLRQQAIRYLEKAQFPKIAIQVTSNINQDLELWDHVVVKHPSLSTNLPLDEDIDSNDLDSLGVPIRVLKYVYDALAGRVTQIEYGDYSVGIKSFIKGPLEEFEKEVDEKLIDHDKNLKEQTDLINNLNKNGHVVIDDDIIYVVDTLPKEDAKNVIQIGVGGIGFSQTGIDGTFTTAWDIEGNFNADFISAGTIEGSLIKTESIQAEHLSIDAKQVIMNMAKGGGTNLIKNSVGYAGLRFPWKVSPIDVDLSKMMDPEFWELGTLHSDGKPLDALTRIRTKDFMEISPSTTYKYHLEEGLNINFKEYDSSKKFISDSNWQGNGFNFKTKAATKYLKMHLRFTDDREMGEYLDRMQVPPGFITGGTLITEMSTWAMSHVSKHSFAFSGGGNTRMTQSVTLPAGNMHTFSVMTNKSTADGKFTIGYVDDSTGEEFSAFMDDKEVGEKKLVVEIPYVTEVRNGYIFIEAGGTSTTGPHTEITDVMMATGNSTYWQQAAGESYTTDVLFDADGIRVIRRDPDTGQAVGETIMTPYEFAGYHNDEKIFTLNGDLTEVKGLDIKELGLYIQPVKMIQNQSGAGSLDIVWTGKE